MNELLLSEITTELNNLGADPGNLAEASLPEKLYEIYILTCVMRALSKIGAIMEVRDMNDNPTDQFVVRLGPGLIYSPATSPGFIFVEYGGQEYELHNGMRVAGRSKVLHEHDVSIIKREDAQRCRANRVSPSQNHCKLLIECKFYGSELPLHLGREYLGLMSEFSLRVKTMVSNTASAEIQKLVTSHRGTVNFGVKPTESRSVEMLEAWLAKELEMALGR